MTRKRLPDKVRNAAARAGVMFAMTVVAGMVSALCVLAGTTLWLAAVMVAALFLLMTGWSLLEVLIARQMAAEERARRAGAYRPRRP
jgi:predicted tellurium resistance membrane protein TerC